MTSKLTREWLQHQISAIEVVGITDSNTLLAFKLALAAMDSEPVAWISQSNLDALIRGHDALVKSTDNVVQPVPLYRHAQPAPVVMDDRKLRALFDSWFASDCSFDRSPEASEEDNIAWRESYWYVWQRCRAAMLQAGTLTNEGETILHNYCTAMEGIGHIRRTLEETFGGLHGTHVEPDVLMDCNTICDAIYAAYSGNSPVIPDGYVMVPKEPTEDMRVAYYESSVAPISRLSICGYQAMLAAAPQSPGSEPATAPGKWIPVSERMPEDSGRYWCYVEEQNDLGKSHYQWNCSWNGDRWWVESEGGGIVTHWQPLPEPPKEPK